MRNDYGKPIVAYQFSLGSTTTLVDSFTNALKAGIEPGEVVTRIEAIDVDPELMRVGIVVRAVVFSDATADGNSRFVREIDDFRLGEMLQTKEFLSSLGNIQDASAAEAVARLGEVASSMLNLEKDRRFSRDVKSGLRNMRLVFSRDIDRLQNAEKNERDSLMRRIIDFGAFQEGPTCAHEK